MLFYFIIVIVISYFPFSTSFFVVMSHIFILMLLVALGLGLVLKGCALVTALIGSYHRRSCSLFGLWIGAVSTLSAILQLYPHFSPQSLPTSSQNQHPSSYSPDTQAPPTKAYNWANQTSWPSVPQTNYTARKYQTYSDRHIQQYPINQRNYTIIHININVLLMFSYNLSS